MRQLLIVPLTLFAIAGTTVVADGQTDDSADLRKLAEDLENPDVAVRLQAVNALGESKQNAKTIVPLLVRALKDTTPAVRAASANVLGKMGIAAKSAIPDLIERLKDEAIVEDTKLAVWYSAGKALEQLGVAAVPQLVRNLDSTRQHVYVRVIVTLHNIGPDAHTAVPALTENIDNSEKLIRWGSLYALEGIGPPAKSAIPTLMIALSHDDFHTQSFACRTLGKIGAESVPAIDELIRLTKEGVASVRRYATIAIGEIGPAAGVRVVKPLIDALNDRIQPVRAEAATSLGQLGKLATPALPALENAMAHKRPGIRVESALAVWKITGQTEDTVKVLVEELADLDHSIEAAIALGEIGRPAKAAVPALTTALTSIDPETRSEAVRALGKIGIEKESLPALNKVREDNVRFVRDAAKAVLEQFQKSVSKPKQTPSP